MQDQCKHPVLLFTKNKTIFWSETFQSAAFTTFINSEVTTIFEEEESEICQTSKVMKSSRPERFTSQLPTYFLLILEDWD